MPRQDNSNIISNPLALINTGAISKSETTAAGTASLKNCGGNNPWVFSYPASPTGAVQGGVNPDAVPILLGFGESANAVSPQPDLITPQPVEFIDGVPFQVVIAGNVKPNTFGKTLRLYLYLVQGDFNSSNPAYYGAPIQLALFSVTLPVQSSQCAYSNFFIEMDCIWDAQSLVLTGSYSGNVCGSLVSLTTFTQANVRAPLFALAANIPSTHSPTPDIVTLTQLYAIGNLNITPNATAAS